MEASTSPISSLLSRLRLFYCLALRPVSGATHAERLENFYAPQADLYDSSRDTLLAGRAMLIKAALEFSQRGTWIDLGCGTGANFSVAPEQTRSFSRVIGVDLAESLLQVARARVAREDLGAVELCKADVTTFAVAEGSADLVTCSYALSMIPDWFRAIERAYALLKPGGVIAAADFYIARKHPLQDMQRHSWLTRALWPLWFGSDNINLSPDLLPFLYSKFEKLCLIESRSRVPFMPVVSVPYFVFIGKK